MKGQAILGRECAWCDLPATCEVQVQSAKDRDKIDKLPLYVPACDDHKDVPQKKREPSPDQLRRRHAKGVEQGALFDVGVSPRSAIRGMQ